MFGRYAVDEVIYIQNSAKTHVVQYTRVIRYYELFAGRIIIGFPSKWTSEYGVEMDRPYPR